MTSLCTILDHVFVIYTFALLLHNLLASLYYFNSLCLKDSTCLFLVVIKLFCLQSLENRFLKTLSFSAELKGEEEEEEEEDPHKRYK